MEQFSFVLMIWISYHILLFAELGAAVEPIIKGGFYAFFAAAAFIGVLIVCFVVWAFVGGDAEE